MNRLVYLGLLLAVASLARRSPTARAPRKPLFVRSTPDGETPSEETFCTDYYKGVSGRLYGLCNSYCEAMDCDTHPRVVSAACFSVGHLLANVAGDVFHEDPEFINPNDTCKDSDHDGHPDFLDNCPFHPNPDQADRDGDGVGDVCDNCPDDYNPGQEDSNGNGIGDACEETCGCVDTWTNNIGNDPLVSPLVGYQCWVVGQPTPPYNFLEAHLVCYNGALEAGYEADTEVSDGKCIDYKPGHLDRSSDVPFPTADDTEACWDYLLEQGGNPDADTDVDFVPDSLDNCPNHPNFDQLDTDEDGHGDVCDNCPEVYNPGQEDSNGNGIGDACEVVECKCIGTWGNGFGNAA
jgi:hypothetical protein